ncbi:hypothetical protein LMG26788_02178 [Achromobacter pulmonis]|uniref:Minor tail T domain-containing protein n=1 Tax=Achromobacter pulmonis TaxID=1389932 RepID=A0A6S7CZC9_9BURK|nr:DUF4035 domain-containing protein [Achromobacter pulmonis]CAB3859325.1 hypothetical protein LMG26788_02178 [Achromobacter pulmonis]
MMLALRLGRTLGEVLAGMDTYELSLWREFDRTSPIGDERSDLLSATLAATVAQAAGAKVKPEDMLIRWGGNDAQEEAAAAAGESAMKAFLLSKVRKTHS